MPTVADWSRAWWITAEVKGWFTHREILLLARTRGTLMILSQLAFEASTAETAEQVADRAAGRMRSVAG